MLKLSVSQQNQKNFRSWLLHLLSRFLFHVSAAWWRDWHPVSIFLQKNFSNFFFHLELLKILLKSYQKSFMLSLCSSWVRKLMV